ncbi:MAG: metallophosphoesterase [Saprospiraceae bacterium]
MRTWLFITDLHLTHDGSKPLGKDTFAQFDRVLGQALKEKNIEAIIIGGDISNSKEDSDVYRLVLEMLLDTEIPYYVIPGNHDDPSLMSKSGISQFELNNGELFGRIHAPIDWIFLDTSMGEMSDIQWKWLEGQLEKNVSGSQFIAMHHPPLICGSRHMEPKYQFKQIDRFEKLIDDYFNIDFYVFCGHFHLEKTIRLKNLTAFITPSTFFQIDPESIDIQEYMHLIGYRIMHFDPDQNLVNTHVRYI